MTALCKTNEQTHKQTKQTNKQKRAFILHLNKIYAVANSAIKNLRVSDIKYDT